ncbi:MAG: RimK family alpha-L-glutamate ligase [Epsilonproteobacteria bacterium]|nr:MAG: RimK family alpha-L-glutamate ligase [Campylobacterota bacterium]RLA67083.1 MAG: RimK family alpha-L-glutamate ligase [Campylobacterota bacterium]
MRGWILYKQRPGFSRPQSHGINRLLEYAKNNSIDLDYVVSESLDLNGPYPDFIIARTGPYTSLLDLEILDHFKNKGVRLINSPQSIKIVNDKFLSLKVLAENNIPVPNTSLFEPSLEINFPVVVKTLSGAQGKGVSLCENKQDFKDLLAKLRGEKILVQEFIESSAGRDLRVFTVGGRPVACVERTGPSGDFRANFSLGGSVKSYPLTDEIKELAIKTSKILNLDVAGVDLLFAGDHFKVCEANFSPGFASIEKCTEVNIPKEIFDFIKN